MSTPYYADDQVTLYLGDCRDVLPALGPTADLILADPPYGETSLKWDRWPEGWVEAVRPVANSMWCFGSMRMFLDHVDEFAGWKFAQDAVWEKHNGSSFHADRFKRVHENALQWYQGKWSDIYHHVPTTSDATKRAVRRKERPAHMGAIENSTYVSEDGGPRLMRSVIYCRSMHGRALHPTEKPPGILEPLLLSACPPGGLVVDPTAGSGSTLAVARMLGMRAIGVEGDEEIAEVAARRLSEDLFHGATA